jgi:hypothetical protein
MLVFHEAPDFKPLHFLQYFFGWMMYGKGFVFEILVVIEEKMVLVFLWGSL